MRVWLVVLTAAFVGLLATPMTAAPAKGEGMQRILRRYLEQEGLSGGVLLVSSPDRRDVTVAGLANIDRGSPVGPDSRFYVASVGKMAVAVAVLQQVEEGLLSLEAPVMPLLGGVPDVHRLGNIRAASLGQLLDHSSGIPDYLTDAFTVAFHARPRRLTPATVLPFAFGLRATGRPGTAHEYSNSNYVLLGDIVATTDGVPFDQALRRRVLDRAGMRDTSIGADPGGRGLAHGYADLDDSGAVEDVSRFAWNSPLGDGPLVTTAADLERFLFALFRDGKLLQPATLARMSAASANEEGYGLGVERGQDRWGAWLGHSGSDDGFEAEARYYPDRRAALVVMVNGNSASEDSILDAAAAVLFGSRPAGRRKEIHR